MSGTTDYVNCVMMSDAAGPLRTFLPIFRALVIRWHFEQLTSCAVCELVVMVIESNASFEILAVKSALSLTGKSYDLRVGDGK